MKASRSLLKEVDTHYPTLPFNIRNFPDANQARLGITECLTHNLFHPYPVLFEKDGEIVAHFKTTLLLVPNGTESITGFTYDEAKIKSDVTVNDETKAILATEPFMKKKKAKKAAAAAAASATTASS